MALQKSFTTPVGFVVSYHTPLVTLNRHSKEMHVEVLSWGSKELSRTATALTLHQYVFSERSKAEKEQINEMEQKQFITSWEGENAELIEAHNRALVYNSNVPEWNETLSAWNGEHPEDLREPKELMEVPELNIPKFTPRFDPALYDFTFDSNLPIEPQVYARLKLMPEYAGATDI